MTREGQNKDVAMTPQQQSMPWNLTFRFVRDLKPSIDIMSYMLVNFIRDLYLPEYKPKNLKKSRSDISLLSKDISFSRRIGILIRKSTVIKTHI